MNIRYLAATNRNLGRKVFCGTILSFLAGVIFPTAARADRSSTNMDPAWMFEKKKKYAEAAMYYHRTLRGLKEMYFAFHWNGDPKANAASKRHGEEYTQIPIEMEDRYETCLRLARLSPAQIHRMESINDLWLNELIDHEQGGLRTACGLVAVEAEKHGDFRLSETLRRGEARFYRVVAVPYHRKAALRCEKEGRQSEAELHRKAVKDYEERAALVDRLAKGHKVLMKMERLGGPSPWLEIRIYPDKVNPVAFQGLRDRLFTRKGEWKGPRPDEVAAILRKQALRHKDVDVRLSAVTVLGNLGEKEAVLSGLNDPSSAIRLTAARILGAAGWAEGWAACARNRDPAVRSVIEPRLEKAREDVLLRTYVVTELIRGLDSSSADTRSFCQDALQRITGKDLEGKRTWSGWWLQLGDARPGLIRTGAGVAPEIDSTVDFGAWWQSFIYKEKNPLIKHKPPTVIQWRGYLAVPRTAAYRFYVRSCGEKSHSGNAVYTPGRGGFPGLYLSAPSAKLWIDGQEVLPQPTDSVQDPSGGVRLDWSEAIRLEGGLHPIRLEFDYRSRRDDFVSKEPCVRLYWSSEDFLRQLVPAECLVSRS